MCQQTSHDVYCFVVFGVDPSPVSDFFKNTFSFSTITKMLEGPLLLRSFNYSI